MRLGIFCNFGPPDHCGGSEEVIKQIAHGLIKYNHSNDYHVYIYAYNQKTPHHDRGVLTVPCLKGSALISQINQNDHILVYSDSFWGWDTIVENIEKVVPDVSVALVGAYHMREHSKSTAEKFMANLDRFRVIVHSMGVDQEWCDSKRIPYKIIPNGVDLSEFKNNKIDFREKYGIKEKHILLNVSNYFYGKGQEYLGKISRELRKTRDDFIFISISSSIAYPYDKMFLNRAKKEFSSDKCLFLRNIPREDVISAYKHSDVFVFTSLKEVAPLVIWEARAAKLPWVAAPVGNVCSHKDGKVFSYFSKDEKGYVVVNDYFIKTFAMLIDMILCNERDIEHYEEVIQHDWKNIIPEYNKVFKL